MPKPKESRKPIPEVTLLELKMSLGDVVSRVGFGNERIAITRYGKKIAALVSAEDLETLDGAA